MVRIAIIMTVFNRRETTVRCLNQVKSQKYDRKSILIDIYLTDDGSTDGTSECVKELFPEVHLLKGSGNLFWNRGMYNSWKVAEKGNYDFYLWLNDDTFLFDNVISRLLTTSSSYLHHAIIVGSTSAVGNSTMITYGGWRHGEHPIKNIQESQKCETFNGNIVLIPRYVYEIIGMNDPFYHHCLGDTDYGLSACKHGVEIWTAKGVLGECDLHDKLPIWQDPHQSLFKRLRNLYSPLGINPNEYFYFKRKHFGLIPAITIYCKIFLQTVFPKIWSLLRK